MHRCASASFFVPLAVAVSLLFTGMSQAAIREISAGELRGYIERGAPFDFILIDVRDTSELPDAVIGSANCKPYHFSWGQGALTASASKLPDMAIILYCSLGIRSMAAAKFLETRGFHTLYSLTRGFINYAGPRISYKEMKAPSLLPEPSMKQTTRVRSLTNRTTPGNAPAATPARVSLSGRNAQGVRGLRAKSGYVLLAK